MTDPQHIPSAFDFGKEQQSFLARAKKKAATKFRMSSAASRQNAATLTYWLLVFHESEDAHEVCRFLGTAQFDGNFSLWSPVEQALTTPSPARTRTDGQSS